ncbi:NfeD family protein [Nocardioides salarius]|uniref:NfeD family protein n=1 Tax=Nocardioides salarius TaxID=374513 RepID=UPI003C6DD595
MAVQLPVFALTGGAGLAAVRPIARRTLALPPPWREGSDALVGRSALVTREVTADGGLVHLSGEDWSLRPTARRRRSSASSGRCTPTTPTSRCWPTSTRRCCRGSPRAATASS